MLTQRIEKKKKKKNYLSCEKYKKRQSQVNTYEKKN